MPECFNPFLVKRGKEEPLPVPCGKCPSCVKRKISQWSFRLMQQEKYSHDAYFITLTYDNNHVPITDRGYLTLVKRDLQLFFKRLRKLNSTKISYYAVGEYGSKTQRPHYHIILFNCHISTVQTAWRFEGRDIGECHYGDVNGASVGYTLKYISKGRRFHDSDSDDRQPEFALMSKRIGSQYLTDSMTKWHKSDINNRMYVQLKDGRRVAMPRYFKDKLYTEEERLIVADNTRKKMVEGHKELTQQELWNRDQARIAEYRKMKLQSTKGDIL